MSRWSLALPIALLLPLAAAAAPGAAGTLEEFVRAVGLKSGGWRTSLKLISAEVVAAPGADPTFLADVEARIRSKIGTVEDNLECAGAASDPFEMPGIILEKRCVLSKAEAAGGRWAIESTCADPAIQATSSFVAQGTYARKTVTGRHEADVTLKGVRVRATLETVSRFTGECRSAIPLVLVPATKGD